MPVAADVTDSSQIERRVFLTPPPRRPFADDDGLPMATRPRSGQNMFEEIPAAEPK
jgi:hypothetical protein